MMRKKMMKSHTDLSWVQTLPLGIIHKKSLPHCWVCKGSLILGACRVRHMDMLDLSQRGGGKWAVLFFPPLAKAVGEGNGTPLQYFCLENPMDGGAW